MEKLTRITPFEKQRCLSAIEGLAARLESNATRLRCSHNTAAGERSAIALSREAHALRWALRELRAAPACTPECVDGAGGGAAPGTAPAGPLGLGRPLVSAGG